MCCTQGTRSRSERNGKSRFVMERHEQEPEQEKDIFFNDPTPKTSFRGGVIELTLSF